MTILRWWPPLLHLTVLAVILPLAFGQIADLATPRQAPLSAGLTTPSDPAAAPATADPAPQESALTDPAVDLAALDARPLFAKSRKASAALDEAPAETAPAPSTDEELRMVGYINTGSRVSAVVAFGDSGREEVVSEGDVIGRMTVQKIGPDSLILYTGDTNITIRMYDR
jgi:hypothetical protein